MHTDHVTAERSAILEHGNLVRGMCPLGMPSQTFSRALGPHAQHVYLENTRLGATTALALGLIHHVKEGIGATKGHAREVASRSAYWSPLVNALVMHRPATDTSLLAREAVGHMECQRDVGGFAKSKVGVVPRRVMYCKN